MSIAAEKAHGKWMTVHDEECKRDLVVGAKVYRANYRYIEEGTVCRISRVRYTSDGREFEDPAGPYVCYHASFPSGHEGQTYQWKWFFKIEDAKRELAKQLRRMAEDNRRKAAEYEDLAATYDPSATKGRTP